MEELQTRHRKEQRDLQSQVTQKKKQASKKTRKGVNEECERLERELKERQAREVAELNGEVVSGDDGLGEELEDLTLQTDEKDEVNGTEDKTNGTTPSDEPAGQASTGKKRNRAKERLARRAAEQQDLIAQAKEEAQNLPDLKTQERNRLLSSMKEHKLTEHEIRADGHCLYSAVADQLKQLNIPLQQGEGDTIQPGDTPTIAPYKLTRRAAASYITTHPTSFVPFLEEPLQDYIHKIRDTAEWGGQLELLALAKTYGVDINVLQDFGRVERIEGGGKGEVWLGYYKHGFGLGEHYNSLRRRDGGKGRGG